MSVARSLDLNVRSYPWYRVATDSYAWIPVFFLYFSEFVALQEVLQLAAVYYFTVFIMEVPSGYFSDRVGRRTTLIIAAVAAVLAHSLFLVGGSFFVLAMGQFCLATSAAFRSGTETALHYDSLQRLGAEQQYADREARAQRFGMFSAALTTLFGGFLGMFNLRFPYVVSLAGALMMLVIAVRFMEPDSGSQTSAGFLRQLASCTKLVRNPVLGWLFGFYMLMYAMEHVPFEFYQAYIGLLDTELLSGARFASMLSGIAISLSMFGGVLGAAVSVRWARRSGLFWLLSGAIAIQVVIVAGLASVLHLGILIVVCFRNFPMSMIHAPMQAAIAARVASAQRATYLSLQGLAGRITFGILLYGLSLQALPDQPVDWPTLRSMLGQTLVFAAVGWLLLIAFSKSLRSSGS